MTNKELLECIAAEEAGKKIECYDFICTDNGEWEAKNHEGWNTGRYIYRIATEPPKREGKWVRKEIVKNGLTGSFECAEIDRTIDCLACVPGFGGIEYVDPRNPEVPPAMSSSPVCFNERGNWFIAAFILGSDMNSLRPGVPVAAWFWEE